MAFEHDNLWAMTYGDSVTFWRYRTADTLAEVESANYFANADFSLRVGDAIWIIANCNKLPVFGWFGVRRNTGAEVEVARCGELVVASPVGERAA